MFIQPFIDNIYATVGNEWVKRNGCVLLAAKDAELAIGGSIAIAIGRKKAIKEPGDLDFVCDSVSAAFGFVNILQNQLLKHPTYWSVQINNLTSFCPDGCSTHFRIKTAFWLPICVMVIPEVNYYRVDGGLMVQAFNDVVAAAKLLDERDGKGRVSFLTTNPDDPVVEFPCEFYVDPLSEDPDPRQPTRQKPDFKETSFPDLSENQTYTKK